MIVVHTKRRSIFIYYHLTNFDTDRSVGPISIWKDSYVTGNYYTFELWRTGDGGQLVRNICLIVTLNQFKYLVKGVTKQLYAKIMLNLQKGMRPLPLENISAFRSNKACLNLNTRQ